MFSRLGPWCHDRRRVVLALWIGALIVANGIAGGIGDDYRQDFTLPGAESTAGFDILTQGPIPARPRRATSPEVSAPAERRRRRRAEREAQQAARRAQREASRPAPASE